MRICDPIIRPKKLPKKKVDPRKKKKKLDASSASTGSPTLATCIDSPPHYLVAGTHRRPAPDPRMSCGAYKQIRYKMYIHPSILPLLLFFLFLISSRSPFFFFFSRVAAGINHNSFSFRMHRTYVLGLYIFLSSVTGHLSLYITISTTRFLLHPFNSSLLHPIQFLLHLIQFLLHPIQSQFHASNPRIHNPITLLSILAHFTPFPRPPFIPHNLYVHVTKPSVCKNVETNLNGHPRQEIMYICTNHRFISILEERKHL